MSAIGPKRHVARFQNRAMRPMPNSPGLSRLGTIKLQFPVREGAGMKSLHRVALASAGAALTTAFVAAQERYKMTTPIPPEITTPDKVETRIGTLNFVDGVPTEETATKAYDQLDLSRGIEVFLNGIPGASMVAIRAGSRAVGRRSWQCGARQG